MLSIHALPLVIQLGGPVLLLIWLARSRGSINLWLVKAASTLIYLIAIHVGGLWVVLPWYATLAFVLGFVAVVVYRAGRIRDLPWAAPIRWPSIGGHAVVAVSAIALLGVVLAGRRPPSIPIVDLKFPLANGVLPGRECRQHAVDQRASHDAGAALSCVPWAKLWN